MVSQIFSKCGLIGFYGISLIPQSGFMGFDGICGDQLEFSPNSVATLKGFLR